MLPHRILLDAPTIRSRVEAIAGAVAAELDDRRPIVLGLLTGSFVYLADLARALSQRGVEPVVDFLVVSHYGSGSDRTRAVSIERDTGLDLANRAVLVVDELLDTGRSLQAVLRHVATRHPAWLRSCVLLDKPSRRETEMKADFVGFEVPDVWLIGYGLDLAGEGRALPYVAAVEPPHG